ncbi:MAG: transcriptional regulator, partial [Pseudohongiellaceae bacterium]
MEKSNLIRKINLHLDKLRKSERKVAEYILAEPAKIINMRIIDLAHGAEVSEPTVIRF